MTAQFGHIYRLDNGASIEVARFGGGLVAAIVVIDDVETERLEMRAPITNWILKVP